MRTVWILGAGRFGLRAARTLIDSDATAECRIVERDPQVCQSVRQSGLPVVCMDGIEFLGRHLDPTATVDWIIPAIPAHVAYRWIACKLSTFRLMAKCDPPAELIRRLPNPLSGADRTVYTSIARFTCPEDCPEPPDVCWKTKEPRPCRVDEVLAGFRSGQHTSVVIRSRSLAPGVGGIRPKNLLDALGIIAAASGPVILSTACRCHGVVDAFNLT